MIPSIPVIVNRSALPVSFTAANIKNSTTKLPKTNLSALVLLNVPQNMKNVNKPHIMKYAASAVGPGARSAAPVISVNFGNNSKITRDHQNKPYELNARVPKVLPFLNSITPAITCANPPYTRPIARIIAPSE